MARPSSHDLSDPDEGFVPGSSIQFGETHIGYDLRNQKLTLDRLDLFNIISISPVTSFFRPISWRAQSGLQRNRTDSTGEDSLGFHTTAGLGLAVRPVGGSLLYGFADADLSLLDGTAEGYGLGVGGSAGILFTPLIRWKLHLRSSYLGTYIGTRNDRFDL